MKKILSLVLVLGLFLTLAGCSSAKPEVNVALEDIMEKINEEMDLPPMLEMEGEYAEDAYPFDRELTEEYILNQAMINIRSDEVALFKLKDQKSTAEIEEAIAKRLEQLEQVWGFYLPDQHAKVKNHIIETNGKYVLFAITDNQDEIVEIFKSFFK